MLVRRLRRMLRACPICVSYLRRFGRAFSLPSTPRKRLFLGVPEQRRPFRAVYGCTDRHVFLHQLAQHVCRARAYFCVLFALQTAGIPSAQAADDRLGQLCCSQVHAQSPRSLSVSLWPCHSHNQRTQRVSACFGGRRQSSPARHRAQPRLQFATAHNLECGVVDRLLPIYQCSHRSKHATQLLMGEHMWSQRRVGAECDDYAFSRPFHRLRGALDRRGQPACILAMLQRSNGHYSIRWKSRGCDENSFKAGIKWSSVLTKRAGPSPSPHARSAARNANHTIFALRKISLQHNALNKF
jgi:hypothetical protein